MKAKAQKTIRMTSAGVALAAVSSLAFPLAAFATESSGISAILPNMNEFIPMVIAFVIIAIILGKFAWPVVKNIVTKREETVKEALEKSEDARIQSERILEEYKTQLAEAKSEAAQIVANAKQVGDSVGADIKAKAEAEAADTKAKAHIAIEAERKAAISELQASVADTAIAVVKRFVSEDLTDDDHRKIIERYVAEAGSLNAN